MPRANANQLEFSFTDLTRILTPRDGDYVTLDSSGRLQVRSSRGSANRQNRQLVNHLLQLFMERMDSRDTEEALTVPQKEALKHYFLYLMEMPENGNCAAISMKRLRQAMDFVNTASSELVRVQRNAAASPAEKRIAAEIAKRLPAAYLQPENRTVGGYAQYQAETTEKLREMLNNGRQQNIPANDISAKQLRNVASGRLFAVQNEVYTAVLSIYNALCNLNHGQTFDVEQLLSNETLMTGLFAYAIRQEAAVSKSGRAAESEAKGRYALEQAFGLSKKTQLLKSMDRAFVEELMIDGSLGLTEEVERRRSRKGAWKKKQQSVNYGAQYLGALADELKRFRDLEKQALRQGLSHEQAVEMQSCGSRIDGILRNPQNWADIELVAGNMSSTRFAPGIKTLGRIRTAGISYAALANAVTEVTERLPQPEAAVQQEPDDGNIGNVESEILPNVEALPEDDGLDALKTLSFDIVTAEYGIPTLTSESQRPDAETILESFAGPARDVAAMLLLETDPSSLIAENDEKTLQDLESLYGLLRAFDTGVAETGQLNLKDVDLVLSRNDSGNVSFRIGNQQVPTIYSPAFLLHRMEEDICANLSKFGTSRAERILNAGLVQAQKGDLGGLTRGMLCDILKQTTGIPVQELSNVPTDLLATYAQVALQTGKRADRKHFRQQLLQQQNRIEPELNEQDTLEALRQLENLAKEGTEHLHDRVEYHPTERQRSDIKRLWTEEEAAVKRFIADMISPMETWQNDLRQRKTDVERLRYTFYHHADTVVMLLQNPQILESFSEKLGEDFAFSAVEQLQEQLLGLFGDNPDIQTILKDSHPAELSIVVRGVFGNRADLQKATEMMDRILKRLPLGTQMKANAGLALEVQDEANDAKSESTFERYLLKLRRKADLKGLSESIGKMADEKFETIQGRMDRAMQKLYGDYEPLSDDIRDLSLTDLIKDNFAGNAGQARYMRKVLGGYFRQADPASRREMLASAFRDLVPEQPGEDGDELQMGSALSGLFKGAGPIFQKTLQGLPTDELPLSMQLALDDVKSRLRSIDPAIVAARMNQLVEDSKGTISKISVERSLGAASVGEAFLCRVYGPELEKEGREAVIKLLRPDVKNRMNREKAFFLQCAKETDAGMAKTIAGQLAVYEKELDLRLEAKNIQRGSVYNKGEDTVKSERLMTLVRPQANALMLEKANGTTVGNYFKQVRERLEVLKADNSPEAVKELGALFDELKKRQGFLTTLAKKWVTEGIFESGFYQADLHKDNIMIDDKQATIIDYGNATQLSTKQRERITKMVFAASLNTPKLFISNYGELMPKASQKLFNEKRGELEEKLRIVFGKKGDPGTKIAVALCEAQKLGLELPSTVYNFSMGQIRLKNTIEEGNNILRSLANEIKRERKPELSEAEDPFYEIHKELNGKYTSDNMAIYLRILAPSGDQPMTKLAERVNEDLFSGKNEKFNAIYDALQEELKKEYQDKPTPLDEGRRFVLEAETKEERDFALTSYRCALAKCLMDYDNARNNLESVQGSVENPKYEDFFDVMEAVVTENLGKMKELMGRKAAIGYATIQLGQLAWNKITSLGKTKDPHAEEKRMEDDLGRFNMLDTQISSAAILLREKSKVKDEADRLTTKRALYEKFVSTQAPENGILRCVSDLDISEGLKRRLMNELSVFSEQNRTDVLYDTNQGVDRLLKAYKLLQHIRKNMIDSDLGQKVLANNPASLKGEDAVVKAVFDDLKALQPKAINTFVDGFEVLTADGLQEEAVLNQREADLLKQKHQDREKARIDRQKAQEALAKKGFVFLSKDELTEKPTEKKAAKEEKKEEEKKAEKIVVQEGTLEEDNLSGLFGKAEKKIDLNREPEFYFYYDRFIEENPEEFKKINSNDPAVLESLRSNNMPSLNQHLNYRLAQLEVIQEAAEDGKARGPVGKPVMDANQQNIVLPEVRMAEKQNTGNGCWSVSLASQLAYRGVNLDQRTIRAHRPDASYFGAQSLKDANADLPNAMPLYTDLIQKLLPNTAVNTVEITEVSKDEARLAMENSIRRALGKDNSPISFLRGGHYRTIYGIQDGKVLMYDSLQSQPDKVAVPLDDLVEECKTMRNGEEVYVYSLQWLQDLKLNAHDEPDLPTIPRKAGVKYMGGSMASNAQEDAYTSRDFMGFATDEKVNSSAKIVMLLPKQLKTTAIDGFYPEALKEIHDHAELAGVSKEALDLLDQYPRKRPTSLLGESSMLDPMIKWADKVQQAYNNSNDASKPYLREALEEVKTSLILQEKLKLKTEIPEKLGDEDGKICYESAKAEQFEEVLAKSLWISKYEQMPAESREWIERTKPGIFSSAKTLAPTEDELEAVKTSDQYAPLFRDMTGRSDVARAQIQPNQGYDPWTVKYSEEIPYVAEMQKLSGNLNQGARLTDSLDSMLTDFAEREKQRQKQKEALQQAKDNVYGQEMAAEPEERKSLGGRSRISSEELAKKLGGDKEKAPENKQKLTRRNSFTPSFATKNSRMQK